MKSVLFLVCIFYFLFLAFGFSAQAQFSFDLIDNFEGGSVGRWYEFGNLQKTVVKNPSVEVKDVVAEACGEFSLQVKGTSENWYVGGVGTDLNADVSDFSRLQLDIFGSGAGGKLKLEMFDD
ncbi:hypothetical protein HZB08_02060, partial [Candidatus Saganbacteria bacterium]|nr:hypothetical protein [Candidatus Saganbacteria bacterium]